MLHDDVIIRVAVEAHSKGEIDLHKQLLFVRDKLTQWILPGEL